MNSPARPTLEHTSAPRVLHQIGTLLVLMSLMGTGAAFGQFNNFMRLAANHEAEGRYEEALQFYLRANYQINSDVNAQLGARRTYRMLLMRDLNELPQVEVGQEPAFSSMDAVLAWRDSMLAARIFSVKYLPVMQKRGIEVDTTGIYALMYSRHAKLYQIEEKWRRTFSDDHWVRATAYAADRKYNHAFKQAMAALSIRPALRQEPEFEVLWRELCQHPVKVVILPFEDLTFQGNGLHRQVFVRLLELTDTLDLAMLESVDGSYLNVSEASAGTGAISAGVREARATGAQFALAGRLTRAINGAVTSTATSQTAYLSRPSTTGGSVADVPVSYQSIERTRELQLDLECELIDLRDGRVIERVTIPFSHTDQLRYSDYPGGNVDDLHFYATRENPNQSGWRAAGNLASTLLELTDGGNQRRAFNAPREFGQLGSLHDRAREYLAVKALQVYLRAVEPRED